MSFRCFFTCWVVHMFCLWQVVLYAHCKLSYLHLFLLSHGVHCEVKRTKFSFSCMYCDVRLWGCRIAISFSLAFLSCCKCLNWLWCKQSADQKAPTLTGIFAGMREADEPVKRMWRYQDDITGEIPKNYLWAKLPRTN